MTKSARLEILKSAIGDKRTPPKFLVPLAKELLKVIKLPGNQHVQR